MERHGNSMIVFVLAMIVFAVPVCAAVIELETGKKVQGSSVRYSRGQYTIETPTGPRTYSESQVRRAISSKPAGWDQAISLTRSQPEKSIAALEEIAKAEKGLDWDAQAYRYIARISSERLGDFQQAAESYERMPPYSMDKPEVKIGYWKVLIELGRYDEVEPKLKKVVQSGNREFSARGQLLRGDINMKQRRWEPAALDFLRVVHFYKRQRSVHAEALYKAGKSLEELRHDGASRLLEELKNTYPDSEYAGKI